MLEHQDFLIALKIAALQAKPHVREAANRRWLDQLQSSKERNVDGSDDQPDLTPQYDWTHRSISEATGISLADVSAAIRRASLANLLVKTDQSIRPVCVGRSLFEFIEHGARYVYPAVLGTPVRGIPTGFASPLFENSASDISEMPPVWGYSAGPAIGRALNPIYKTAPMAAAKDPLLYELLVLVDVFRLGREARKSRARDLLVQRLA